MKIGLKGAMMIYRLPTLNDEAILNEYVKEHHDNGENSISASLGLSSMPLGEWVKMISINADQGNEEWGRSLCLLCLDHEKLIGLLSVRYELSAEQSNKYGDIGYGVRPSERKKGYATEMLKYALKVCREKGLSKVILGCFKDNIASVKTIQKNGGILIGENDNYRQGRLSQYYLVDL